MKLRVKDFTSKVGSGVTPRGGAEVYKSEGIPLFRSQNVTNEGLLLDDIAYIDEDVHQSMSGTQLKAGDVLLNITGASIGRCYYLPKDFKEGNVNQHVCIIRPKKNVIPTFLYYHIISDAGQQKIDLSQTGANREGLTKEDICSFDFDIPSLEEQKRIVSYLDSKTASIDKKVTLLIEKRDAYLRLKKSIINRAVTKGLNPDVKMKDSGVEWIGEIPEGWNVRLFHDIISHSTTGLNPRDNFKLNDDDKECNNYYVTIRNFKNDILKLDGDCDMIDDNAMKIIQSRSRLKKGDVIMASISETPNTYVLRENPVNWNINESVFALRPNKLITSRFLHYLINCELFYNYLRAQATGSTFTSIKQYNLLHNRIIVPTIAEQNAIVIYIDEKISLINKSLYIINTQIEKYKLLKRALINEVVTGKRAV